MLFAKACSTLDENLLEYVWYSMNICQNNLSLAEPSNGAKLNIIALLVLKIGRRWFRGGNYLKIKKSWNLFERFNLESEKNFGCICQIKLHTKFHVSQSKNKESID